MVKSHVARISRIIQPFSVDPILLQRVQNLQQRFESEVQAPVIPVILPGKKGVRKKRDHARQRAAAHKPRKVIAVSRTAKRAISLSKRVQRMAKRAKPLGGKLEIARRRARR
jgi:hypothetical protein